MSDLPGYDDWKTHNPDDDRCEFCGVHPRECRNGWKPNRCTGECGRTWRDPDYEYEQMRDAMRGWHMRDRDKFATWFGSGEICSQEHADYSQVVVVGQNRGRRIVDCNDLDHYALGQIADALRRHGWTVKPPKISNA